MKHALIALCLLATPAAADPFLSRGWTFDEADGAALYAHVCAACHQPDGRGASGAGDYPALKGDEKLASTNYLIAVLLGGQHAMPALGRGMSDAQAASLVNYLRATFANAIDDPATAERVKAARAVLTPK